MPKTGIIIANTGSPDEPTPEAVEAYLRQFLMDPRIRQLPKPFWKLLVYRVILPKRKFTSARRYQLIWTDEGSPLVCLQQRMADMLQERFDTQATGEVLVLSGMSYGNPSILGRLERLRELGCEHVVLLPLYPQSAYSPTQAVCDAFKRALRSMDWHPRTTIIDNYHDNPLYIALVAKSIREAGFVDGANQRLLLSWHAIPLKDERAGDTYRAQIKRTVDLLASQLGIAPELITVGFQSVFGRNPNAWVSPLSLDILRAWRSEGFEGCVFFMNPGFSVDCLETLYDIPREMKPALTGMGNTDDLNNIGAQSHTYPAIDDGKVIDSEDMKTEPKATLKVIGCFNDSPEHIDVLYDVLKRYA